MLLRFEPTAQAKGVQVWHEGKKVQDAKVVDLYANCFVKRNRANNALSPSTGPAAPPAGLRLSALRDGEEG